MLAPWPKSCGLENAEADAEIGWLIELISEVRSVRSEMNVPAAAKVPLVIAGASDRTRARVALHGETIKRLARLDSLDFGKPLEFLLVAMLVALFSSSGGLALGCSVGQTQIGLMFSLVLAPMMMFGCAYYPWSALEAFPILHVAVLANPLVYASEGLRGALVPQVPHMNTLFVIGALAFIDLGLIYLGLRKFHQKAVS